MKLYKEEPLNIYFASPLFSDMERKFNKEVVEELRSVLNTNIYLPQENASINDKSLFADSKAIANADNEKLEEADVLVAVLDGIVIDTGVATEIGYAYGLGKPIIGLYTDSRQFGTDNIDKIDILQSEILESQFPYQNLYTVGVIKNCGTIVNNVSDLIKELHKF